jgi:hypothetical protein
MVDDNYGGSGHLDYLDFNQYNESLHVNSEDNEISLVDNYLITSSLPLLDEDNNLLNESNKVLDESENTIAQNVFDQLDAKSNHDEKLDLISPTGQALNNESKDSLKNNLSGEDKVEKVSKAKQKLLIPTLVQSLAHLKEIIDQLALILDSVGSSEVLKLYSEESQTDLTSLDNWNRLASKSINDLKNAHSFKHDLNKVSHHDNNFMKNTSNCLMLSNNDYINSNVANTSSDDQEVMVNDKSLTGISYAASPQKALNLSSTFLSFINDTNKNNQSLHEYTLGKLFFN